MTGKHYSIADKEVSYNVPAPTNEKQAEALLKDLEQAHSMEEPQLIQDLDIDAELLEMAWEEAQEEETVLTPDGLVELCHSAKPSHVKKYEAWRLLKSEIGHVFFKELKEKGRVVAFKAKGRSSVEASKDQFLHNHQADADAWGLSP